MPIDVSKSAGGFLKVTEGSNDPVLLSPVDLMVSFENTQNLKIRNRNTEKLYFNIPLIALTIGGVSFVSDKPGANAALEDVFSS